LDAGAEFAAAFGLNPPPHISPKLRQALGFSDGGRRSGRGSSSERRFGSRSSTDRRGGYNDRDSFRNRGYGSRDDYNDRNSYGSGRGFSDRGRDVPMSRMGGRLRQDSYL
jgi:hypothetical protein